MPVKGTWYLNTGFLKHHNTSISEKISRLNFFEFGCLLLLFFLLFIRFIYIFTYDTDLEGVEFALVHFVQMIILKGHLYGNAAKFPYLLVVHAPLYYYAMAAVMKTGAIDVVNDVHMMYIIGRSISFFLLFISVYVLLKTINLLVNNFRHKIIIVLIFVLFLPNHFYSCRPDSLKFTFFILFLYVSIRYFKNKKWSDNLYALLFLFLSILSKQDVLIYSILFYAVFYMTEKKITYIITPVLLMILISLCVFIFYVTSGINLIKELFFFNLQYDRDISINLKLIAAHTYRILPLFIFSILNTRSKNRLTVTLSIISILYFFISCLFMLRIGSNFNYTYESVFLMLINSILYTDEKNIRLNTFLTGAYFLSLFIFNQMIYYKSYFITSEELNYRMEFVNSAQSAKKIKEIIGKDVLFIPNMKYYIFYPDTKMIYGSDWHYDRYCEIALDVKIKPKFIRNDITAEYDKQFTNGVVQYILTENNQKSKNHITKYYPYFSAYKHVDNFILYKFKTAI